MSQTKKKMDKFLNSFGDSITIHAEKSDVTHKSIDHIKNSEEKLQTTTPYSIITKKMLTLETLKSFEDYEKNGYTILENLITPEQLKILQLDTKEILDLASFGDNDFYGSKTKRTYSFLTKSRSLDEFLTHPRLNEIVSALFAPNPLLSAIQLNEIFPGEKAQKLHYDQQFMNLGSVTRGEDVVQNFLIAVDDFTETNGATILIPNSNKWELNRTPSSNDLQKKIIMKAGSVLLFSGNLWHAGGENCSIQSRRGIICVFVQPWLRTLENHFLSIPFELAAKLHPQIQSYIGYSLHHPFIGQVDFQHPKKFLCSIVKNEQNYRSKL